MSRITEESIIRAFKENDNLFLSAIYTKCYPVIVRYVSYNNGDDHDAKDLIQDAFMIIFRKVKNNKFELTSSFKTYLYSICKNLWLKELRRQRNSGVTTMDLEDVEDDEFYKSFENEYTANTRYFLFRLHFHNLTEQCRQLIRMSLRKIPYEEISAKLNLKNSETARKLKFRCKSILINRIKDDSQYKEMYEDEK
ncbi:MAG: sigma-70 family RNA polymerase sigma factor [Bacteroidetes bacterium]|nr:sigma-70 family RNA polymerase sigma factor [Bacteroidota bacterium]